LLEHSGPLEILQKKVENTGIQLSSHHVEPHGVSRLHVESDVCKGSTDTPQMATQKTTVTIKLGNAGSAKPVPMATDEDGTQRKAEPQTL